MSDELPPLDSSSSSSSTSSSSSPPQHHQQQQNTSVSQASLDVSPYDIRRRSTQIRLELGDTKGSGQQQQQQQQLAYNKHLTSTTTTHHRPTPLTSNPSYSPLGTPIIRPLSHRSQLPIDNMHVFTRRNSDPSSNPPSPFHERKEFMDATTDSVLPPSTPTSLISLTSVSPPSTPTKRASNVLTDPFSDTHRASTTSTLSDEQPSAVASAMRTPSISSIVSLSTKGALPNFDVHVMYKVRTTNSSKKLSNFFGEQIPLDVCVKEIEREGLGALLHSKVPLCYFLKFLLDEYSSENLFFFIEVEQYESFQYHSRAQQLATAQHIHETYLTRNSQFEVNVEDRVRKAVVASLYDQTDVLRCFEPAKRAVFALLEGSYTRHRLGPGWARMVREVGENTIHYGANERDMAVNHLLEHIARQHDALYTNPHTDALISTTSRRRHELLKSMVHEFCRTMVGVDFDYYRPEPQYNRRGAGGDSRVSSRMPAVLSDGEGSSDGDDKGVRITGLGRQRSKSFGGKKNKDKSDGLFGKRPGKKERELMPMPVGY